MSTPHPLRPSQVKHWNRKHALTGGSLPVVCSIWMDRPHLHPYPLESGEDSHYLINPFGPMFDEITASMLLGVSLTVLRSNPPIILTTSGSPHSLMVLKARPISTLCSTVISSCAAVSAMRRGLLPLSQHANVLLNTLSSPIRGCHDRRGRLRRLAADLGGQLPDGDAQPDYPRAEELRQRHSGILLLGDAYQNQVDVLASGEETIQPDDAAIASLASWSTRVGAKMKQLGQLMRMSIKRLSFRQ